MRCAVSRARVRARGYAGTSGTAQRSVAQHSEMGDEEMALTPGVQYGLSSQEDSNQNKYVIFTRLTDSSYRAIQEYVKNQVSDELSSYRRLDTFRVREARIGLSPAAR